MKANREDIVQAALLLERWCRANADEYGNCDCPFCDEGECRIDDDLPCGWGLEAFLRTRGLKHD